VVNRRIAEDPHAYETREAGLPLKEGVAPLRVDAARTQPGPAALALASAIGNQAFIASIASTLNALPDGRLAVQRRPLPDAEPVGPQEDSRPRLQQLIADIERFLGDPAVRHPADAGSAPWAPEVERLLDRMRGTADSGDQVMMDRVLTGFTPDRLAEAEREAHVGQVPGEVNAYAGDARIGHRAEPTASVSVGRKLPAISISRMAVAAPAIGIGIAAGPPGWVVLGVVALAALAVGATVYMSRPGRNTDQNRQFADAVREIERRIGRRLSADEKRRLHEELHHHDDPGYHDIVEIGVDLFGRVVAT